uniref:Uncharacterized protein n=1 Tax=Anopheles atroparvus TaxID=41427 RepID=A0A182IZX3_ANOAO
MALKSFPDSVNRRSLVLLANVSGWIMSMPELDRLTEYSSSRPANACGLMYTIVQLVILIDTTIGRGRRLRCHILSIILVVVVVLIVIGILIVVVVVLIGSSSRSSPSSSSALSVSIAFSSSSGSILLYRGSCASGTGRVPSASILLNKGSFAFGRSGFRAGLEPTAIAHSATCQQHGAVVSAALAGGGAIVDFRSAESRPPDRGEMMDGSSALAADGVGSLTFCGRV